jgi:hypothetical protein
MAGTVATPPRRRIPMGLIIVGIVAVLLLVVLPMLLVLTNLEAILNFVFDVDSRVDPNLIVQCYGADGMGCPVVHSILYSLIFFFVVLTIGLRPQAWAPTPGTATTPDPAMPA